MARPPASVPPDPPGQSWQERPAARALFLTLALLAVLVPYWWLAVQWSQGMMDPAQHFTFMTTTFLLVLIVADSAFLVRYYQLVRVAELEERAFELRESRERLELALAGADLGTWNWDITTGRVIFNERWAEMLGYRPDDIEPDIGAWERLVHPDDMPRVRHILAAHLEGITEYYECEHRLRHRDSSWVWVLDKGRVTRRDGTGRPLAAAGTHLDITDRVRVEHDLRESERKYRTIIENMQDMFYRTDLAGRITMISPSGARLAGYESADELIGRDVLSIYADPAERDMLLSVLREKGSVFSFPVMLTDRYGSIRHVTTSSHFFRDEQGRVQGVEGVIHDITDQRKAEAALRMANKKLGLLTSITRHDIRNQLMALGAYLQLVEETSCRPVERAELEGYIGSARKIVGNIERQISFTKDYEDLGAGAPVWQDAGACAAAAMSGLAFGRVQVLIEVKGLAVYADPMLEKVFFNLYDNALRYGGERLSEIRVFSHEAGAGRALVVADNGAGISPKDRPRIFEKGYGRNTGLGLFLSREILAITGITIEETGAPGRGARFEMTVPSGGFRNS